MKMSKGSRKLTTCI